MVDVVDVVVVAVVVVALVVVVLVALVVVVVVIVEVVSALASDIKNGTTTAAATPPTNKTPASTIMVFAIGLHWVAAPPARLEKNTTELLLSIGRVIYRTDRIVFS